MQSTEGNDKATPVDEPFSMLINAIERDLERTPEGRGGEIHYTPATPRHGGMGHNGDYLLREWREVTAALAAERDRADRAQALLEEVTSQRDELASQLGIEPEWAEADA